MPTRILVTHKGETGYLHTETGADLRTRYGVTFDVTRAATFTTQARAQRQADKIAHRFDRVQLEP